MKILFISGDSTPFNPTRGSNIRSYYICKSLCELGEVDVLCLKSTDEDIFKEKDLLPVRETFCVEKRDYPCGRTLKKIQDSATLFKLYRLYQLLFKKESFYFVNKRVRDEVAQIINARDYDAIFVQRMDVVIMTSLEADPRLIVDIDDHPSDAVSGRYLYKNLILRKIAKIKTGRTYKNFREKVSILLLANKEQISHPHERYLPNLPYIPQEKNPDNLKPDDGPSVLFIGSLAYAPNYTGLQKFINDVWRKITEQVPECKLNIVGRGLPEKQQAEFAKVKGVKLWGYQENLDKFFRSSTLCVSPIYSGAGTNIKILESIMRGLPIVATPFSIRGYEDFLIDGQNIFIGESDNDFAEKVVKCLKDDTLRKSISANALDALASQCYNYNYFIETIKGCVNDLSSR